MKSHKGVLPSSLLSRAASVSRKPDTGSGKMSNVIRYVTSQDPAKKASLGVKKCGA